MSGRSRCLIALLSAVILTGVTPGYGDKLCLKVSVNKRLKVTTTSVTAPTCPRGFQAIGEAAERNPFGRLPSGATVRGVIGGSGTPSELTFVTQSLPASGGRAIKTEDMIIAHTPRLVNYCNSNYTNAMADCLSADEFAKDERLCTGTFDNPVAPRGKVCIYIDVLFGGFDLEAQLVAAVANSAEGSPFGFGLQWSTAQFIQSSKLKASWAYTAP